MGNNLENCGALTTSVTQIMGGPTSQGKMDPKKHWLKRKENFPTNKCGTYIDPPPNDCWYQCEKCYHATLQSLQIKCACQEGLKFSLTKPDTIGNKMCNQCRSSNIGQNPKGYLYCNLCNYDKCYNCIQNNLKAIDFKGLVQEVSKQAGKKGVLAAASATINKAVQVVLGGVVPGVGAAVLMHFNGIYAATQGDSKGVIKAVTGGFGGMSGAVIGTIVCPGIGTLVGGLIGAGIGAIAGWGAGKLITE